MITRLRGLLGWGPLVVALLASAALWTLVDRWWLILLLGYGPRWPWLVLVPIPLLATGAFRRRLIASAITLIVVAWGLLGFRMAMPGTGTPDAPVLRVTILNAALKSAALDATLSEATAGGAELIVVVECPARDARFRNVPGFSRAEQGEICVWSRTVARPRITMAPRDFSSIGWSGSIAVVELPGTPLGSFGVLHLRSVRNELAEFLDISSMLEQSDSMESRRSKRIAGSIYASNWYRSLPEPPSMIMGDFNLVPESSRFRADWGDWTDAWESAGIGVGYTWHSRWYGLRIDRLIHSEAWRTRSVRVGRDVGSDHRPLFFELERR